MSYEPQSSIITVGRDASNTIVLQNSGVSRHHLRIIKNSLTPSVVFIEDLDSTYGTYVNGIQIRKKSVAITDEVWLGPIGKGARFDLRKVLAAKNTQQTMRQQFLQLEHIYNGYTRACIDLRKKERKRDALISMPFYAIPIIGPAMARIYLANSSLDDKLLMLKKEFQANYVCPKCSAYFTVEWTVLKQRGACYHCKTKF